MSNPTYSTTIICASCGKAINLATDDNEYYKCEQCIYHHVCKNCSQLPVNKDSKHKLNKVCLNNENQSSSIFTDENYSKTYLIYCHHCLDIIWYNKQVSYSCEQCPDFAVCEKCIELMSTYHPTQHRFNQSAPVDITGQHFGVTCDGCKEKNLSGIRYQCKQCESSYDLCSKCFQKAKTIHNESHSFQYYQDPLVCYNNRKLLAERTLALFRQQNITSNNQRDLFTGWTKTDAEKIVQREDEVIRDYKQRCQEEEKLAAEMEKRRRESEAYWSRKRYEQQEEDLRETLRMIHSWGGTSRCPKCGADCNEY